MIKVENLRKSYGNIESVKDMSFKIGENEIVGLLGSNGAGKSTTMRMITGYIFQDFGKVEVMGIDMVENPVEAKKYIGYLPETPPLYMDMTVEEHLKFICSLKKINKKHIENEIVRVCNMLNIFDVKDRLIKNLSKGYKQRIGFAAAILGNPKILILDEPTVGLDPQQIIDIRNLIKELSKNMSIIISSHILSEITSVCSRIIIVKNGTIIVDGTQMEIENNYSSENNIEMIVKGDFKRIENILKEYFEDKIKVFFKSENSNGETNFIVTSNKKYDAREDIFKCMSKFSDELSIITMRSINISLEEIFIDIMNNTTTKEY
ncbi:MAG: ABC transporter ATP-binding protein [Proteocatella sp.]